MKLHHKSKLYEVSIVAEKGGYVAWITEQPKIISQGDTIDQTIQDLFLALDVMT